MCTWHSLTEQVVGICEKPVSGILKLPYFKRLQCTAGDSRKDKPVQQNVILKYVVHALLQLFSRQTQKGAASWVIKRIAWWI